jgi:hypothetical protein
MAMGTLERQRWTRGALSLLCALAFVALLAFGLLCSRPSPARASTGGRMADGVTATLALPTVVVTSGDQISLPLEMALVSGGLLGVDVAFAYDPTVVSATAVTRGPLAAGWSIASNRSEPGQVQVGLAGAEPITGDGQLLVVFFEAVGTLGSTTTLTLTQGALNEGDIPVELDDGEVDVCHWADVDCSCLVDGGDLQAVAGTWRCERGGQGWISRHDLDGDEVITIVDIMRVAAWWGWSCSPGSG